MTRRTYSADEFRNLLTSDDAMIATTGIGVIDEVRAALRIAARVMEPGVIERAIRVGMLGPANGRLEPPAGTPGAEYEARFADTIRSALTKDTTP